MSLQKFDPAYKANLKILENKVAKVSITSGTEIQNPKKLNYEEEALKCAFEQLVSWCINGEWNNLENAIGRGFFEDETIERPIIKDLLTSDFECVDSKSGYNIPEIVSISGKSRIMRTICRVRSNLKEGFFIKMGKALEYAIANEDEEMVRDILWLSDSHWRQIQKNFLLEFYGLSLSVNQIKKLSKALIRHADTRLFYINDDISNPKTAIQLASELGQIELVKLFLENNVNPNAYYISQDETESQYRYWKGRDKNKKTALHLAAENGHFDIVKELIDNDADVFPQDVNGNTPMQLAKKALLNCVSEQIRGDLEKIVEFLTQDTTKKLLQLGPDYNAVLKYPKVSRFDRYAHSKYDRYTHVEARFQKLISACIDKQVNEIVKSGSSKDISKEFKSQSYCNLFFLKLNAQDANTGFRAIDFAVINGNLDTVRYLLQNGAQVEVEYDPKNTDYYTYFSAIDLAIWKNDKPMIELLIDQGLDSIEKKLIISVKKGLLYMAKKYEHGVNVDKISNTGLHQAAFLGRLDIVKYLVTKGANVNAKSGNNSCGRSALHLAVENGFTEIVEYLVEHGADVFQQGNDGLTAKAILEGEDKTWSRKETEYVFVTRIKNTLMDELGIAPPDIFSNLTHEMSKEKEAQLIRFLSLKMGINKIDNVIGNKCQLCGSTHPNPNAMIQHYTKYHFNKQCEKDLDEFFPNGLRYCSKCDYNDETKSDILKALCHVCYHKLPEYIKDHQSEAAKPKHRQSSPISQKRKFNDNDDHVESKYEDMLEPFMKIILNKDVPIEAKTKCIGALEVMILKNLVDLKSLTRKAIIEEIGNIAEEIIDKITEEESDQDLITIAKILNKINSLEQGKKLIKGIRMPIGTYERLKTEMNKQLIGEPSQFAFNSDSNKRIKTEIIDIDSE